MKQKQKILLLLLLIQSKNEKLFMWMWIVSIDDDNKHNVYTLEQLNFDHNQAYTEKEAKALVIIKNG